MSFVPFAIAVAAGVFALTVIVPIATFLRTRKAAGDVQRIGHRLDALEAELRRLQLAARKAAVAEEVSPAVIAPAAPPAALAPPAKPAVPPAAPLSAMPPVPPAGSSVAPPSVAIPPVPPVTPVIAPAGAPPARTPASGAPVPTGASLPAAADRPTAGESLESRIGGRWLLYAGTAALVLGIGFFVKYAFDNDWIDETGRVLIGAAAGLAMVAGGHRIARRGYGLYGQIVAGGGFAALFISVFAAFDSYALIGRPAAFGLMVLVTAGAAVVANMHRSQGLAVVAVVGGFLTPFLVGGGENAQVALLTYDTILAVGTMAIAAGRGWPFLNIVSYAFVLFTFFVWGDNFYTPAQWKPTQLFLTVFGALFTWIGVRARRDGGPRSEAVGMALMSAPLIYHAASVANLQPQWMALLVYLTIAAVAGVAASMKVDRAWLRLVVFALTAPVLWQWIGEHGGPGWRVAPAVVALALYVMNLLAIGERLSRNAGRWFKADVVLFHLNALGLFAGLYAVFDPVATAWMPALALAGAAWHGALTWFWRGASEEASLNSLAVAFAMLGFAIGLQFDEWWAVVGWAIESAAIVWVGLKSRRDWMRLGGAMLLAWTIVRLVSIGFFEPLAGFSPVINARVGATLVIVAACYVLALLHQRHRDQMPDRAGPEIAVLYVIGNVLTIVLFTTEISFYWRMREATDATAGLARSASVSVAWALYGTALIVVGIVRKYAPVRYLAIALLAVTIVKALLSDLSMLGGIYRIIGFVGLGVALLLGAWLYQRYRDVIVGRDQGPGAGR
jgi:uncharacterized membrane protein